MKSYFSRFIIGLGSALVVLFVLDEIFLFLREAYLLPIRIEETVIIYLTLTPFLAALLYSMCLFLQRQKALSR